MPKKIGRDPAQYGLFATPLEAMIAPDAEVRVIAAFVDQLNLSALNFQPINTMVASAYESSKQNFYFKVVAAKGKHTNP